MEQSTAIKDLPFKQQQQAPPGHGPPQETMQPP